MDSILPDPIDTVGPRALDQIRLRSLPTGLALAYSAAVVIILHLLPFFLIDHDGLLTLLAFAGVVVNASALAFVDPTMVLLAAFSATVLLACVLLIACIDCVRTSMLSQLKQACTQGTWLLCVPYEL